jgi:hypothetical protein
VGKCFPIFSASSCSATPARRARTQRGKLERLTLFTFASDTRRHLKGEAGLRASARVLWALSENSRASHWPRSPLRVSREPWKAGRARRANSTVFANRKFSRSNEDAKLDIPLAISRSLDVIEGTRNLASEIREFASSSSSVIQSR